MHEAYILLEDFVEVVSAFDEELEKQKNLAKAWELIAKSLMGAGKE